MSYKLTKAHHLGWVWCYGCGNGIITVPSATAKSGSTKAIIAPHHHIQQQQNHTRSPPPSHDSSSNRPIQYFRIHLYKRLVLLSCVLTIMTERWLKGVSPLYCAFFETPPHGVASVQTRPKLAALTIEPVLLCSMEKEEETQAVISWLRHCITWNLSAGKGNHRRRAWASSCCWRGRNARPAAATSCMACSAKCNESSDFTTHIKHDNG